MLGGASTEPRDPGLVRRAGRAHSVRSESCDSLSSQSLRRACSEAVGWPCARCRDYSAAASMAGGVGWEEWMARVPMRDSRQTMSSPMAACWAGETWPGWPMRQMVMASVGLARRQREVGSMAPSGARWPLPMMKSAGAPRGWPRQREWKASREAALPAWVLDQRSWTAGEDGRDARRAETSWRRDGWRWDQLGARAASRAALRAEAARAEAAGEGGEGLALDGAGALGGEWRWMVGR